VKFWLRGHGCLHPLVSEVWNKTSFVQFVVGILVCILKINYVSYLVVTLRIYLTINNLVD
jgi:hypothetical protein